MSAARPVAVRIRGGVTVLVPDDLQERTTFVLLEVEDWFESEIDFVRRLLQPGDLVVDVGSSFGVYALTSAKAVTATGRVLAFEPARGPSALLRASAFANGFGHCQIVRAALSDVSGFARLQSPGDSTLAHLNSRNEADGERVRTMTLDEADDLLGLDELAFVKIDAEGHEAQVLAGGTRLWASRPGPVVMYEISAPERANGAIASQWEAWGYELHVLIPGLNQLAPVADGAAGVPALDPFALNLFAIRPERAAELTARGLLATDDMPVGPYEADGRAAVARTAWGQRHEAHWAHAPGGAGASAHRHALDLWAAAHAPGTPAVARYGLLLQALARARAAVDLDGKPARLATLARLLAESGARVEAVGLYKTLADRALAGGLSLNEPCLPPSPPLENVHPGARPDVYVTACLLERVETLRTHSGAFVGTDGLPLLDHLHATGISPLALERRRVLTMRRAGLACPTPPVLLQDSAANRNAAYWAAH